MPFDVDESGAKPTWDEGTGVGAASTADLVTPEAEDRYGEPSAELGRGGVGRVALVRDRHLDREVARKELLVEKPEAVARFLAEARITARLDHPNIVPVYELGRSPEGRLYYTMRRIRGRSLGTALADAGDLGSRLRLLPHFVDACQAMAWAHTQGIVHRDLKPENVLVGEFGETQVVDWGLAKHLATGVEPQRDAAEGATTSGVRTRLGAVVGTPAYMSPEQARGERDRLDERTDVWGLGAILFEILTGRPPILGDAATTLERAVQGQVDDVAELEPRAPAELVAVVRRALRPRPAERYPTAAALAEDVEAFERGAVVSAYRYTAAQRIARFARQHRDAIALAAVGLAGAGLALGLSWRSILAERDRAVTAEETTRAELARSLSLASAQRYGQRDDAGALVLAAGSLVLREDPRARGLLVAAGNGYLPSLAWVGEEGVSCWIGTFSADGGSFACRGARTAYRWTDWPRSPPSRAEIPFVEPMPGALSFAASGTLAISGPDAIHLWKTSDPAPRTRIPSRYWALTTPLGEGLALFVEQGGSGDEIAALDADGNRVASLPLHARTLGGMVALPDGDLLFAGEDCAFERWNPVTGVQAPGIGSSRCYATALSPDGRLLFAAGTMEGGGDTVEAIPLDGSPKWSFEGASGDAESIAVSPDGRLLFLGSSSGDHVLVDPSGERIARLPLTAVPQSLAAFSRQGRLATAGADGRPRAWHLPPALGAGVFVGHEGAAFGVVFPEARALLSAGEDGKLIRFDLDDPSSRREVRIAGCPLGAIEVRGDALWVGDDVGFLHPLDARTLEMLGPPLEVCPTDHVLGRGAPSPDGSRVAYGCHGGWTAIVGDGPTLLHRAQIPAEKPVFDGVAWTADGASVALLGRATTEILIVEPASHEVRERWPTGPCGPSLRGANLARLPDGRFLHAGESGICLAGHAGSSEPLADVPGADRHTLAVSPDGRLMAAAGARSVGIWALPGLTLLADIPVRARYPWILAFDADSRHLAVPSTDGRIHVLDLSWLTVDAKSALTASEARFGVRLRHAEVVEDPAIPGGPQPEVPWPPACPR